MTPPPRRPSSLRMAVVHEVLGRMVERLVARWQKRRASGQLEVSDELLDTLAREARIEAHEAVADMHAVAFALGRNAARAELELPPDAESSPADDTRRLGPCPLDGRQCPVPAATTPRKDPDDAR